MATEKRLIDAKKYFEVLRDDLELSGKYFRIAVDHLNEMPTVDAVEVVRCKDCKYRHDSCFAGVGNTYCDKKHAYSPLNGYCSFWRKE